MSLLLSGSNTVCTGYNFLETYLHTWQIGGVLSGGQEKELISEQLFPESARRSVTKDSQWESEVPYNVSINHINPQSLLQKGVEQLSLSPALLPGDRYRSDS